MTRTVVVRLFEPAPSTGRVELAGVVEDVARRATQPFACTAELLEALQRIAGDSPARADQAEADAD